MKKSDVVSSMYVRLHVVQEILNTQTPYSWKYIHQLLKTSGTLYIFDHFWTFMKIIYNNTLNLI